MPQDVTFPLWADVAGELFSNKVMLGDPCRNDAVKIYKWRETDETLDGANSKLQPALRARPLNTGTMVSSTETTYVFQA